jgi:predicted nucleic acid-binding protein
MGIMKKIEDEYFVDTNIFLRVLLKDELRSFNECVRFLDKIKQGEISGFTSTLVLAEINWVLLNIYKFHKIDVIDGLFSILNLKNLKIKDEFRLRLAIEIYANFQIKFIDALIASNPKIYKKEVIVVSYDKDFDKIGVKRKEPSQII